MTVKRETKSKLLIALALIVILALLTLFLLSGDNYDLLKSLLRGDHTNEELRDMLSGFGWRGHITVAVLSALQVLCTFLPAEPVQVLAGLTFGFPVGLLCCWAGVLLGNSLIFLLQKTFGDRMRKFFIRQLNLDLDKIARSNKCALIIFILYFLPAIPYGMICFFAAGTGMRYRRYIFITMLGSLPSICIGVGLGYVSIAHSWILSLCIFLLLLIVLAIGVAKRDILFAKLNRFAEQPKASRRSTVREANTFLLTAVHFALKLYCALCGVRVKAVNKVGVPEKPSIVLCNHGSFIDFIFAAGLLLKSKPHFVVARLYFYDKALGRLLRTLGAFPKSMFALDMESTKNCITVLRNGGCLAMMPEARLSTTGRFEDIQSGTYSFLKKSGVPVYTVKFGGDYLADPKWGKGFRRGALVEAELDILYTPQQLRQLSVEEIKKGVEERLSYNEFQWLSRHPKVRYRSRRLAEGLENILTTCPVCGSKYTLTAKRNKLFCEHCGLLTTLDDRYHFTGDFPFADLTQWYDWQKDLLKKEIEEKPNYTLTSHVALRLPSRGRGLTRPAGDGICTLSREGLTYTGTKDGQAVTLHFTLERIYRLLFGAGENFEIYDGTEILYFVPDERRSAVQWYLASMLLHDENAGADPN